MPKPTLSCTEIQLYLEECVQMGQNHDNFGEALTQCRRPTLLKAYAVRWKPINGFISQPKPN